MEKKNILYEHQYGFRNYRSYTWPLLNLLIKLKEQLETMNTQWYFLDVLKAFDTVDHGIKIKKIQVEYYFIQNYEVLDADISNT